ncbi:MAG: hypothetical protein AB7I01_05180 [Gammaproteobacteria bacterium]
MMIFLGGASRTGTLAMVRAVLVAQRQRRDRRGRVAARSARVALKRAGDFHLQFDVLRNALAEVFDIYHIWPHSVLVGPNLCGVTGLYLLLFEGHSARILHRFTGWELRLSSANNRGNPRSPFLHGFVPPFDENAQRRYIDMFRQRIDVLLEQDPEMQQFMVEPRTPPRCLTLSS